MFPCCTISSNVVWHHATVTRARHRRMQQKNSAIESLQKKNIAVSADSLGIYSSQGDLAMVKLLLNAGIEVNAKNSPGSNALIEASWTGKQEILLYLLDAKADVNSLTSVQFKALSAAINQKQEPVVLLRLNMVLIQMLSTQWAALLLSRLQWLRTRQVCAST